MNCLKTLLFVISKWLLSSSDYIIGADLHLCLTKHNFEAKFGYYKQ